jgi:hypothetical protein
MAPLCNFQKLPPKNNRPIGENSTNLVTLLESVKINRWRDTGLETTSLEFYAYLGMKFHSPTT